MRYLDGSEAVGRLHGRSSPMNKRVYCAIGIGHVELEKIICGRDGLEVVIGVDVGKFELRVVPLREYPALRMTCS